MCVCLCVLSHVWADHSNSNLCVYILCMHAFFCVGKSWTLCVSVCICMVRSVLALVFWTGTHPNCPAGHTQNNQCLQQELTYHTHTHTQNALLANANS